jgi:ParB family transcriptional regulator, chromosome partitioning protein
MPRNALGRGLGALIREPEPAQPTPETHQPIAPVAVAGGAAVAPAREPMAHGPQEIDIDLVEPSPYQPRTRFREEGLEELARSIQSSGIIQPIVVRPVANRFQLIAGERRWRAAQRAGLQKVAAIVRQVSDELALEMTLVENIQREDLNPMETARAFEQLVDQYHLTHEQIAERTGKDRSTITNSLRLLRLAPEVQDYVAAGRLSMGHARALLGLERPASQVAVSKQVIERDLSVRATEALVRHAAASQAPDAKAQPRPEKKVDANTKAALEEMAMALGTKVRIVARTEHSGRIEIEYYSQEDMQRVYEVIVGTTT